MSPRAYAAQVMVAQGRAWIERLGWPAWIGVAAAAAAAVLWLGVLPGLHRATAALNAEVDAARARLAAGQAPATSAAPADPAAALVAQLPGPDALPAFIEQLHLLAAQSGLQLERAEYRAQAQGSARWQRQQVVLPVRGSYPQLRRWLDAVLARHPSATLDEFTVRREGERGASVDSRVQLSFYWRESP